MVWSLILVGIIVLSLFFFLLNIRESYITRKLRKNYDKSIDLGKKVDEKALKPQNEQKEPISELKEVKKIEKVEESTLRISIPTYTPEDYTFIEKK